MRRGKRKRERERKKMPAKLFGSVKTYFRWTPNKKANDPILYFVNEEQTAPTSSSLPTLGQITFFKLQGSLHVSFLKAFQHKVPPLISFLFFARFANLFTLSIIIGEPLSRPGYGWWGVGESY